MRQITLRGIPEDIETIAEKEAKSRGVSLNKAFLSLLRKGVEQQTRLAGRKKNCRESEFNQFLGLWDEEEAVMFDKSLKDQRKIDTEQWS
jgi:hypothetical protein